MAKAAGDAQATLWKDRKRILGLPISFTRYEVTDERFVARKGLLTTETNEILLYRILDIKLVRRLGQKIFGVGTITLFSADKSDGTFEIVNVKNPDAVRRFLSKIVEQARASKGITGKEIYGAAVGAGAATGGGDFVSADFADVDGDGIPD